VYFFTAFSCASVEDDSYNKSESQAAISRPEKILECLENNLPRDFSRVLSREVYRIAKECFGKDEETAELASKQYLPHAFGRDVETGREVEIYSRFGHVRYVNVDEEACYCSGGSRRYVPRFGPKSLPEYSGCVLMGDREKYGGVFEVGQTKNKNGKSRLYMSPDFTTSLDGLLCFGQEEQIVSIDGVENPLDRDALENRFRTLSADPPGEMVTENSNSGRITHRYFKGPLRKEDFDILVNESGLYALSSTFPYKRICKMKADASISLARLGLER
jgi:hypothetical protein